MTQPNESALANQALLIVATVEWANTTTGTCEKCGQPANGGPLATLNVYNLPNMLETMRIVLQDEVDNSSERSNAWYFQAMREQMEGVFNVAHHWTVCWQCVGTFLYMLTDQKEATVLTLKRALTGTQDSHGGHTKPWTTVVLLGGEREKHAEWGYIMAHMPHPLAHAPLSALLREGMQRNVEDNFDMRISDV